MEKIKKKDYDGKLWAKKLKTLVVQWVIFEWEKGLFKWDRLHLIDRSS